MIYIEELLLLLQNIPLVLQYFLPGYFAVMIFAFFNSKKIEWKTALILSCLFSYLSISITSLFYQTKNALVLSGISFILLTVLSVVFSTIYSSKWFKSILVALFHKTPHDDIWHDVLDLKNGSNLKIYFKNKETGLIGHHVVHEENKDDPWFAVSAPIKFDINTENVLEEKDEKVKTVFRLNDVEKIEIY